METFTTTIRSTVYSHLTMYILAIIVLVIFPITLFSVRYYYFWVVFLFISWSKVIWKATR